MWPNVGLKGYHRISKRVAKLSSTVGHGMMVVVRPDEVSVFEKHAKQFYQEQNYPQTAGWSDFGFGIYGNSPSSPYPDGRVHDSSGNTTYGSDNEILVPFLMHSNTFSNPNLLLMNLHQQEFRGRIIDSVIACAQQADPEAEEPPSCGVVSDFTEIFVIPGPAAVFFQPIFPADDPTEVVGFIGTSINWQEVLTSVVPDYIDGLHCVICTDTLCHTYIIHQGRPELLGEGDLHDKGYTRYGHSVTLNVDSGTQASKSMSYTLTVYPSAEMFSEFYTKNPLYVAIGFVCVIALCTAVFFLYDHFMKYQSRQRKEILEIKRRFVRFISHEIRTPLNVVYMGLEILQDILRSSKQETNIPAEHIYPLSGFSSLYELAQDVKMNTENAICVLNDLLSYDKIESGTFKLDLGRVDIVNLVQKTAAEFRLHARNGKKELDLHIDGGFRALVDDESQEVSLYVLGDSVRLAQVLRNLISNALKFSPEKGRVKIFASYKGAGLPGKSAKETANENVSEAAEEVLGEVRAGAIVIRVQDEGPGLSPEQVRLVFREGVQFDPNKLQAGGGSGLGLCIAAEIVQQHGGTIRAESDGHGLGATFILELPLHTSGEHCHDMSVSEVDRTLSSGASSLRHRPRTILVVDDSVSCVKMMVRLLERAGHQCVAAYNGQEAVNMCKTDLTKFDTILMDNEMPVLSGPEAVQQMRQLGIDALIMRITGNVLAEDIEYFESCGVDHVLAKPCKLATIENCWA